MHIYCNFDILDMYLFSCQAVWLPSLLSWHMSVTWLLL